MSELHTLGGLSVQDRDLLGRLSQYFNRLADHVRDGEGWFIFGLAGNRGNRIARFITERLVEYQPLLSFYFVPWRDFALNAYIHEVELASRAEATAGDQLPDNIRREQDIATRVSRDTYYVMAGCDVLVIAGLTPRHRHEARFLDKLVDGRYRRRIPTMLLTPRDIPQLANDFEALDPDQQYWPRLYSRMYDRSLFAV